MVNRTKTVLVIGVDQAIPYLLRKFIDEGKLPALSNLLNNGVYTEGFSCPPCDTPTNWTTIATGATTAVHGNTSFYLHIPGDPLDKGLGLRSRGSLSSFCQAEYIWDVADKNGIPSFVLNYPSGWPGNLKNGAISLLSWPLPESQPRTLSYPASRTFIKGSSDETLNINEVKSKVDGLESKMPILGISIEITHKDLSKPTKIPAFMIDSKGDGYDTLSISSGMEKGWQKIELNQWSDWIPVSVASIHGEVLGLLRVNLIDISKEGTMLKLKTTNIYNTQGWTNPDIYGEEIIRNAIAHEVEEGEGSVEFIIEGKVSNYVKKHRNEAISLANIIEYMKSRINWQLCYFHIHLLDSVNHRTLALIHEDSPLFKPNKAEKSWEHVLSAYQIVDGMVAKLMKTCVDDRTVVMFLADHGAIPTWKMVNIPLALIRAGLLTYKWMPSESQYVVDWNKTLAFPYLEPSYIWVNLKGREPHGIVESSDYEDVRKRIIKALYHMRDDETGNEIVKLALKREDAAILGQNGPRIGDVVYYLHPPYTLFDGRLEQLNTAIMPPDLINKPGVYPTEVNYGAHAYYLPSEMSGPYSISVPIIINGPGIQKGLELKRPINLVDIAPTLSSLMGIPRPKDSQGRIIFEAFQ